MAPELDLSIIIINWNSAAFVRKCLLSIAKSIRTIEYEVIVIDNASYDGCSEMITSDFPKVHFVQSPRNLGFARGNNLGFQHSTGRNVLFLNPDTEVVGHAIERLVQFLDATPSAGVVGAKLLNSDLTVQTSCIQRFPSVLNRVLDADLLRKHLPNWSFWGTQPLFDNRPDPSPVEMVSGACQMLRRAVFERLHLYDTDYFMYAEDADLCWKAEKYGFKNYYVGDAIIVHHGGQSSEAKGESNFATVMMRESLYKFFSRHSGSLSAYSYRFAMSISSALRIGLLAILLIVTLGQFRRIVLVGTMHKWASVFRWSVGLETWVETVIPTENGRENAI